MNWFLFFMCVLVAGLFFGLALLVLATLPAAFLVPLSIVATWYLTKLAHRISQKL